MPISKEAIQTGYYKVGLTKTNVSRLWLQGMHLAACGFTRGVEYTSEYNIEKRIIILRVVTSGVVATSKSQTRSVSGREDKKLGKITPIIELANADVFRITQGAEKVRADLYLNEIHISIHHLDSKQEEREARLAKHLSEGFITKGVLCAGGGISTAATTDGLEAMGVHARTEFIIDRERRYLDAAFENNHAISKNTKIIEASLEEIEPSLVGYVDELSFSLPCTGHSPSGLSKNKNVIAEAHKLDALALFGAVDLIRACNPSVIISENVVPAQNSATYILLCSLLETLGYTVTSKILDSDDTHSLENRRRYWFVATSNGLAKADFEKNWPEFKKTVHTVGDILEDPEVVTSKWKSTAEKIRKAAVNKANGKNFGFNLVDESATKIGVIGKDYMKDRASEARLAGPESLMRLFTPKEIASAQSVPHHLIENLVATSATQILGQGIDYRQGVGVAVVVAKSIYLPLAKSIKPSALAA